MAERQKIVFDALMQSCTKRKTNAARETEQIPDSSTGETRQCHCMLLSKWTEEFASLMKIAIEGPPITEFCLNTKLWSCC